MATRYYKEIEGKVVFFKNPLVVDGMSIFNPSEEILLTAGWQVYIEPEPTPVDTTQYEPYTEDVVAKIKALMQAQVNEQSDEEALNNIELFPTWISKMGESVSVGERLYHDGKLWKVIQAHTVQESWKPDVAASLFVQVQIDSEQGTKDNPIPYSLNMELVQGKYYTQNNVTYLCIRALAQSVWDLSALVGNFVEVVE
jgi:hypothetical protein